MVSAAGRETRLGTWKIHILHHAEAREVWGMSMLDELEHRHRHRHIARRALDRGHFARFTAQ